MIFLTAGAASQVSTKVKEAGAADYITKPFEAADLMEKIKKCLTI